MENNTKGHPSVRISDIKIYRYDIPLRDVFQIATMGIDCAHNVLIRIETNDGVDGWGEAAPFHAIAGETQALNVTAAQEIRPLLLGKNPLEIAHLVYSLDRFLPHNSTIKSAFDMALYDIAAQVAGLPLYALLGGAKQAIETDMTIGICDPDEAAQKALAIKQRGFRIIKVKLGLDYDADHARLANIRRAVGDDTVLRIDANQGWDRTTAIHHLDAFKRFNIEFCEQPCRAHDWQGMRSVNQHSSIPIMADESLFSAEDALKMVHQDIAPYFNIKLSKSGGIHHAARICQIAETAAIPCMIGCMSESRLGITAAAHLGVSSHAFRFYDLDSHLEHAEDAIVGGIEMNNGLITLPDEPGIGARPDPAYRKTLEEE